VLNLVKPRQTALTNQADKQNFAEIQCGRYLSAAADCAGCHTQPGAPPFAGGRPIETPFGNVVAPSITPDRETGIGGWSDEEFVSALREGKGRSRRTSRSSHALPVLPPPV